MRLCQSHNDYNKLHRCTTIDIENIRRDQNIYGYNQQVCDTTIIL